MASRVGGRLAKVWVARSWASAVGGGLEEADRGQVDREADPTVILAVTM